MTSVSRPPRLLVDIVTGGGALLFAAALLVTADTFARSFTTVVESPTAPGGAIPAVAWNALWFTLFALHHSLFARPRVRQWMASVVTEDLERSVYVWTASLLLLAVVGFWRPVPGVAWQLTGISAVAGSALQLCGIVLTLVAAAHLGITRLSGLSRIPQTVSTGSTGPLRDTGLYGFVRHPIYFAWLLLVWPTPVMTGSRLTFAILTTAYLVVAVPFEERTLRRQFGAAYDDYRRRIRWRMLPFVY